MGTTGEGNLAFAWMGWSVACAGDVNGDNFSDVIIGLRDWSNPEIMEGAAAVYHGTSDIVPVTLQGFESRWVEARVEVTWTLLDITTELNFTVKRKTGSRAEYKTIFAPEIDRYGNRFVFSDRSTEPENTYTYRVAIIEAGETVTSFETSLTTPSLGFSLFQNHPNPFNPLTRIEFTVDRATRISLRVYDTSGKLVRTLMTRRVPPGTHSEAWDGRDADGRDVASGTYFIRLEGGGKTLTRKAVLLR